MAINPKSLANLKGRPPGCLNKNSILVNDLRSMVLTALNNKGGITYLEEQAEKNPKAFMTLLAKILPNNVSVSGDAALPGIKISFETASAASTEVNKTDDTRD
jgi:hypothetical protein